MFSDTPAGGRDLAMSSPSIHCSSPVPPTHFKIWNHPVWKLTTKTEEVKPTLFSRHLLLRKVLKTIGAYVVPATSDHVTERPERGDREKTSHSPRINSGADTAATEWMDERHFCFNRFYSQTWLCKWRRGGDGGDGGKNTCRRAATFLLEEGGSEGDGGWMKGHFNAFSSVPVVVGRLEVEWVSGGEKGNENLIRRICFQLLLSRRDLGGELYCCYSVWLHSVFWQEAQLMNCKRSKRSWDIQKQEKMKRFSEVFWLSPEAPPPPKMNQEDEPNNLLCHSTHGNASTRALEVIAEEEGEEVVASVALHQWKVKAKWWRWVVTSHPNSYWQPNEFMHECSVLLICLII